MAHERVLVLGGNFAGLTAALSVKHELGRDAEVTVVSKSDRFQFNPSLIWVPFGKRTRRDLTFPVAATFEARGVDFVHAEATRIDVEGRRVEASRGHYDYDYLLIMTGYLNDYDVVPGLGPGGNARSPISRARSRPQSAGRASSTTRVRSSWPRHRARRVSAPPTSSSSTSRTNSRSTGSGPAQLCERRTRCRALRDRRPAGRREAARDVLPDAADRRRL